MAKYTLFGLCFSKQLQKNVISPISTMINTNFSKKIIFLINLKNLILFQPISLDEERKKIIIITNKE